MIDILKELFDVMGAFFQGRGFTGGVERPASYYAVRLAAFAFFVAVMAGIWRIYLARF